MRIKLTGKYRVLTNFECHFDAPLSIITGLNGSGKSQIISLISEVYYRSMGSNNDSFNLTREHDTGDGKISISDINFVNNGILFWGSTGASIQLEHYTFGNKDLQFIVDFISAIIKDDSKRIGELQKQDSDGNNHSTGANRFKYVVHQKSEMIISEIEKRANKNRKELIADEIAQFFPEEILLENHDLISQDSLEMIFYMYAYKKLANEKNNLEIPISSESPWDILNKVIASINLPLKVTYPKNENIEPIFRSAFNAIEDYKFQIELIESSSGENIGFHNLSSGEKVILSLAILLYYSKFRGSSKKLLLLDEPDAHLHPSLTQQFFKVLYDIIIKEYGGKVIMTTHSPSTLALSPENDYCKVYELKKNPTSINHVLNKSTLISYLSNGLLLVAPINKIVYVEGTTDKPFYEALYNLFLNNGYMSTSIPIIFAPCNNCDSVKKIVKTLRENGQYNTFGIVDLDSGNEVDNKTIFTISRYNIENYLLDPIIIFAATFNENNVIDGINYSKGDESSIGNYSTLQLQSIADYVIGIVKSEIKPQVSELDEMVTINYLNQTSINVPKWLLTQNGKDLISTFQKSQINYKNTIYRENLVTTFKRVNLIPTDLMELFKLIKVVNSLDR
jgi:predicted ATPase